MAHLPDSIPVLFGLAIICVLLSAYLLKFSAEAAGVKEVSYFRALLANFAAALVSGVLAGLFSLIPGLGGCFGWILSVLAAAGAVAIVLKTTFGKGITTLFFAWVLSAVVGMGLVFLLDLMGL